MNCSTRDICQDTEIVEVARCFGREVEVWWKRRKQLECVVRLVDAGSLSPKFPAATGPPFCYWQGFIVTQNVGIDMLMQGEHGQPIKRDAIEVTVRKEELSLRALARVQTWSSSHETNYLAQYRR